MKYLRIFYIIPTAIIATIAVWFFRYIWFVQEVVPPMRSLVGFWGLIACLIIVALVEKVIKESEKKDD